MAPLPDELQGRLAALREAEARAVDAGLAFLEDGQHRTDQDLRPLFWPAGPAPENVVMRRLIEAVALQKIALAAGIHSWASPEGDGRTCFFYASDEDPARFFYASDEDPARDALHENGQPGAAAVDAATPAPEAPGVAPQAVQDGGGPAELPPAPPDANEIVIDPQLAKLLPPHTPEEHARFEANLKRGSSGGSVLRDFLTPQALARTVVDGGARGSVAAVATSWQSAISAPTTHTACASGDGPSGTLDSSSTAASSPATPASSADAATAASAPRY